MKKIHIFPSHTPVSYRLSHYDIKSIEIGMYIYRMRIEYLFVVIFYSKSPHNKQKMFLEIVIQIPLTSYDTVSMRHFVPCAAFRLFID